MKRRPPAGDAGEMSSAGRAGERSRLRLDAELLRLLAGELPPGRAAALERRLAAEPALAARREQLARRWQALSPPPEPALPLALTARVMAAVRREAGDGGLSWRLAPVWVRAAAATALAAGVALGAGIGHRAAPRGDDMGLSIAPPETLAASYWAAVEEETSSPASPRDRRPSPPVGARP